MTNWPSYIQNLNNDPLAYDADISRLLALTKEKPWEAENFFLLAKLYENYPADATSHHEQFDNSLRQWASEQYDRAVALKPLPEYIAERDAFRQKHQIPKPVTPHDFPEQKVSANSAQYYQSSGKMPFTAVVYLAAVGVTAIPVASFLFALAGIEIPHVVFKFLLPVLFAALVGAAINMALIGFGKTRNGLWGFLLASMATFWAYYLYWIFFFVYISDGEHSANFSALISAEGSEFFQKVLYLIKNPALVWEILGKYVSIGNWNVFGININGGLLVTLLVVEFIAIYLIAVFIGFMNYDKPFDELNNRWFKYEFLENEKYFTPEDQLVSRLESGQYKGLLDLNSHQPNAAAAKYFSKYTLFYNGSQYYLTVENAVSKLENSKWSTTTEELVSYISISQDFAAQLRAKNAKISSDGKKETYAVNNMNMYDAPNHNEPDKSEKQ